MPTLELHFPGGRYHATPWGHHVNEGLIEWPPSPWRLLRALIACGFSGLQWAEVPPPARRLIGKLAGVLPSFRLPEASAAHSRHFMPVGGLNNGREQTTLVFDTWAAIGDGVMLVHWPCDLDDEEAVLLGRLATSLGYLGRSESWVEAELVADDGIREGHLNSFPAGGAYPGPKYEQVALMAAIPPEAYQEWHRQTTTPIVEGITLPESARKPTTKQLEKLQSQRTQAVAAYPPDLLACLTKDTAWWKGHGWSRPPGSHQVLYWRRSDSLQIGVLRDSRPRTSGSVTTMLLSLTTASGNRAALPPLTRTLPQAELFHRAVVDELGQGRRVHCPELTGKDELGRPFHDHHRHAHTVPLDLDGDGHLDHIVIVAEMGLGDAAQRAIRTLRRTRAKGRRRGDPGRVGRPRRPGNAPAGAAPIEPPRRIIVRPARRRSGLGERHPVRVPSLPEVTRQERDPRQINAELSSRRLPQAEGVHIDADLTRELRHFVRRRYHGGVPPPVDEGYGLRLSFAEPLRGPLLLGYAAHYRAGIVPTMLRVSRAASPCSSRCEVDFPAGRASRRAGAQRRCTNIGTLSPRKGMRQTRGRTTR